MEASYLATLTVPNRVESVRPATAFLVQVARSLNVPASTQPVFEVAISEALTNALRHGNPGGADATITCEIEVQDARLRLRIIDGGAGFRVPPPRMPEARPSSDVQALPEAGYGLPIIQTVFPNVRVVRVNGRFGVELEL